jgi:hypothetical protein
MRSGIFPRTEPASKVCDENCARATGEIGKTVIDTDVLWRIGRGSRMSAASSDLAGRATDTAGADSGRSPQL